MRIESVFTIFSMVRLMILWLLIFYDIHKNHWTKKKKMRENIHTPISCCTFIKLLAYPTCCSNIYELSRYINEKTSDLIDKMFTFVPLCYAVFTMNRRKVLVLCSCHEVVLFIFVIFLIPIKCVSFCVCTHACACVCTRV